MNAATAERIKQLFLEHFDLDASKLQPEATVESLGLDSLDMVDFIYTLEQEFHIRLPEREMRLNSLQEIVDLVGRLQHEQNQNASKPAS
jgi:acyl carrier protein